MKFPSKPKPDPRPELPTKEQLQREAHEYLMRMVGQVPLVRDLFGDDASQESPCVARDQESRNP